MLCDKQNIVHLVAYIYILTSNEEISKIEKTLFDKRLVFPDELMHGTFQNTCVECPGIAPGYANAQPPGRDKIADAPPPGLTT